MTEQEQPEQIGSEQQDDVEGHRKKFFVTGEQEPGSPNPDADGDDDVEGHRFF